MRVPALRPTAWSLPASLVAALLLLLSLSACAPVL
jgi:hypothetical protein